MVRGRAASPCNIKVVEYVVVVKLFALSQDLNRICTVPGIILHRVHGYRMYIPGVSFDHIPYSMILNPRYSISYSTGTIRMDTV